MNIRITRVDFLFLILTMTFLTRQYFYKPHDGGFSEAFSTFTFDMCKLEVSICIISFVALAIPTVLLCMVFYDIHKPEASCYKFYRKLLKEHGFYCCICGCALYIIDIIQDYYAPAFLKEAYSEAWHKYILHFILAPPLFVDSVYNIEIQKIIQKDQKAIKKIKGKIYYLSQIIVGIYLIYCMSVVLFLEGQLGEIVKSVFQLRMPVFHSGISYYIKNLSNNAIECVFLTLFFGLIDRGIVAEKFLSIFKLATFFR